MQKNRSTWQTLPQGLLNGLRLGELNNFLLFFHSSLSQRESLLFANLEEDFVV